MKEVENSMVTITDALLRNNIFETVYDKINTGKSSYGASSIPSLYGALPDVDPSFPAIVIENTKVDEDEFTVDTTRTSASKSITVIIHIFAKKGKDVEIIADGISANLRSPFSGATLISISDSDGAMFPNEQKIKMKTLSVGYMRRS